MKLASVIVGMVLCFALGLVIAQRTAVAQAPSSSPSLFAPEAQQMKKCSFQSDCPYGTCKNGQCGGCSFQSDCKGWGKCSNGQCGACSFQSDCAGFGACKNGHCEKSPY